MAYDLSESTSGDGRIKVSAFAHSPYSPSETQAFVLIYSYVQSVYSTYELNAVDSPVVGTTYGSTSGTSTTDYILCYRPLIGGVTEIQLASVSTQQTADLVYRMTGSTAVYREENVVSTSNGSAISHTSCHYEKPYLVYTYTLNGLRYIGLINIENLKHQVFPSSHEQISLPDFANDYGASIGVVQIGGATV